MSFKAVFCDSIQSCGNVKGEMISNENPLDFLVKVNERD